MKFKKSEFDKFSEYWGSFVEMDQLNPEVPEIIAASWRASKNNSVNFLQSTLTLKPHKRSLKQKLFVDIVDESVSKIAEYLHGSNSVIQIFDENAILLNLYGDEITIDNLSKINNKIGANLSREVAGTNAVELAIEHKQPILTVGPQHYSKMFHEIFCYAFPLKNNHDHNIFGVLDLTGDLDSISPHVFSLIKAATLSISNKMEYYTLQTIKLLNDKFIFEIDTEYDNILLIHENGEILNRYINRTIVDNNFKKIEQINYVQNLDIPKLNFYMLLSDLEVEYVDYLSSGLKVKIYLKQLRENNQLLGWVLKIKKCSFELLMKEQDSPFDKLIGESSSLKNVVSMAKKVASSNATCLILGETGTGKELFARAIHDSSSRAGKPFITVNCGAIPKELIASELFGYEEGAFTGAKKGGQLGKFELADTGTIFLDEVGELPLEQQVYLLRALQEKEIFRVGGKQAKKIDVRVIAATNVDLISAVEEKKFREDLYFRLNVVSLKLPPIRERGELDIEQLIHFFVDKYNKQENKNISVSAEAMKQLRNYHWPGNVRELENKIYSLVILAQDNIIDSNLVASVLSDSERQVIDNSKILLKTIDELEKQEIINAMIKYNGNLTQVAKKLNISRATLYRKLKKYDLEKDNILNN
ncbi:sigma-54 interaction domain-containing protein [Ureibacillus endophyticus]|uniref:AAA family ATPase n=1 Tax=Ureibacillus endophyticus TaxID=1978490 RepID=A0A494YSY6_9BACL|nr:sigma 54-interacting transcriptional regulator [Lysinibacillus endophyticus]RKQ13240.1 AAA family ATPase [Lysinibacillus endophyticus]